MSKEKVTIPKEIAEAIEVLRESFEDHRLLDTFMYLNGDGSVTDFGTTRVSIGKWLKEDFNNLYKLASAIINDYEVEQSPEERLREYYRTRVSARDQSIVLDVLNILGIKIEGINKEG